MEFDLSTQAQSSGQRVYPIKETPCWDVLNSLLAYDSESGRLRHKERPIQFFAPSNGAKYKRGAEWAMKKHNSLCAGKFADSCLNAYGYRTTGLLGRSYLSHRLVWFMHFPDSDQTLFVDHINGDTTDNRLSNLRLVDRVDNQRNTKLNRLNKSGVPGVFYFARDGRWQAFIGINGKRSFIGSYSTKEEAVSARLNAEKLEKYHPNHGRR